MWSNISLQVGADPQNYSTWCRLPRLNFLPFGFMQLDSSKSFISAETSELQRPTLSFGSTPASQRIDTAALLSEVAAQMSGVAKKLPEGRLTKYQQDILLRIIFLNAFNRKFNWDSTIWRYVSSIQCRGIHKYHRNCWDECSPHTQSGPCNVLLENVFQGISFRCD